MPAAAVNAAVAIRFLARNLINQRQDRTVKHSKIVGGSTAKRVIACPGSVALVDKMPPQPSSSYADTGTLLHDTIADILDKGGKPEDHIGRQHADIVLTQDLIDDKLVPALALLDEIDPKQEMHYEVETQTIC